MGLLQLADMIPETAAVCDSVIVILPAEKIFSLEIESDILIISETEGNAVVTVGNARVALISDRHLCQLFIEFPDDSLVGDFDFRTGSSLIVESAALDGDISFFHVFAESGKAAVILEIENGILRNFRLLFPGRLIAVGSLAGCILLNRLVFF